MNPISKQRILIVQDSQTLQTLGKFLGESGYETIPVTSAEQALERVTQEHVDFIITELNLPGMDGIALARKLRQNESTRFVPIVAVTWRSELADKVAGFEAGVDDYITKPYQHQELVFRLKVLSTRVGNRGPHAEPGRRGRIIALFGTKGGVGRTTIGVNLAVALHQRTQKRVVLFDADFFFGDMALHLGLKPSPTIVDLTRNIDHLDAELLEQVLHRHASGIRVLLSPREPESVETIVPTHLSQLLNALVSNNDYVLVDCQAIYDERTLAILEKANAIMLVIKPELGCVKNLAVFSELDAKLGLHLDKKIHVILNRAGTQSGIAAQDIERFFKRPINFNVASGGNAVVQSVNRGTPLVMSQPRHAFSRQVMQIADYIAKSKAVEEPQPAAVTGNRFPTLTVKEA